MKQLFFILAIATIALAQADPKTSPRTDTLIIRSRGYIDLLIKKGGVRYTTRFFFKNIDQSIFSNNDIKKLEETGEVIVRETKSTLPTEVFPLVKIQRTYRLGSFIVKSVRTSGGPEKTIKKYVTQLWPKNYLERGEVTISWWLSILWIFLPTVLIIVMAIKSAGRNTWRMIIFSAMSSITLISIATIGFDNGAILGALIGFMLMAIMGAILGYSIAGDFGLLAGPIAGIASGTITGTYAGLFSNHHAPADPIWNYIWYYLVIAGLAIIIHLVWAKVQEEQRDLYIKSIFD